jgi:hypothetical protein
MTNRPCPLCSQMVSVDGHAVHMERHVFAGGDDCDHCWNYV